MSNSGPICSDRRTHRRLGLGALALSAIGALALLTSCKDPLATDPAATGGGADAGDEGGTAAAGVSGTFNEDCPADDAWMPADGGPPPPLAMFEPPPHPDTECPFYRGAYQNFLIAMHPDSQGDPDIVHYATIADAFQSAYDTGFARNTGDLSGDPTKSPDPLVNPGGASAATAARQGPPTGKAWLGAVRQAGQRNVLIDHDGRTLYYGLHMNQAFVDFITANGLGTPAGILKVDPNLEFPAGIVEFKSAWKDIDPRDFPGGKVPPPTDFASDPGDYSNYITTNAWLPWLSQDPSTGTITEDPDHPILRKVALVAIHCVYTVPGHPEFVWGSVQHVNIKEVDPAVQQFAGLSILGMPDSQPNTTGPGGAPALPDPNDPQNLMVTTPPDPTHRYLLYTPGTLEKDSNVAIADKELGFTEATQSFAASQVTNVYRVFPGSKANDLAPDTAVFSLNSNLNALFSSAISAKSIDPNVDKRQNYRLVAAVWMDKPALFGLGTKQANGTYLGLTLQNDDTNPLVQGAQQTPPNVYPDVTQGVTCGTPTGLQGQPPESGDVPGATALDNTVPGCDTRYDDLHLPDAGNPVSEPDGGPINPSLDYQNHTIGTDSPFSILGGEDRLSSTSMETFTQNNTFHNCFACHNTQPINAFGVSADPTCLPPNPAPGCPETVIPFAAKINVSHMFSEFIVDEEAAAARAAARSTN